MIVLDKVLSGGGLVGTKLSVAFNVGSEGIDEHWRLALPKLLEPCQDRLMALMGLSRESLGLRVRSLSLEFHECQEHIKLGDEVIVETWISTIGGSSFTIYQEVSLKDMVVIELRKRFVAVDGEGRKSPLPVAAIEAMRPYFCPDL